MRHPKEVQFHFTSAGHRLAAVHHPASAESIVVMAHGYTGDKTEHLRLLVTLGRALAANGISVLRFDFMGSGDSTGDFHEMTPNTEVRDLHGAIDWAQRLGYRRVGLFGLSMGGAVAICTAAQRRPKTIATLVTWSAVPDFAWWVRDLRERPRPIDFNVWNGDAFYTDLPQPDVPAAFASLEIPRLQCQGTEDLPEFRERFEAFFAQAPSPKKHLVVPGADHTFTTPAHRQQAADATVAWFEKYLNPPPAI
ncbi:MAG: alpha/beta fold hydrolase [Verrucomicrobiota bacterium]